MATGDLLYQTYLDHWGQRFGRPKLLEVDPEGAWMATTLRERLQARLERELQQMEQWWQRDSNSEALPRLQAQSLADQLAAVDELEGQLKRLLGESDKAE